MLNSNDAKQKEADSKVHLVGGSLGTAASLLLANPVMLECCFCSGPYVSYSLEEAWQPRQRTQAMDIYYHNDPDPETYCCPDDSGKNKYIKCS
ncbi:hypothetical protein DPEC_G00081160 [Dallia pectoralis]|uniref:Uncharacterized protein n=1 Tax=Dallia pectoralis TaxID=75939 RepID=A0ACC2GYK9_DALPE|nr:hypothetical protein DPEC_G00081160 [Dallia pectoralis]